MYADINLVPRGTAGSLLGQANSNIGGFGATSTAGNAPAAQTMRKLSRAMIANDPAIAPTAAQIGAAITAAGASIQAALSATDLATIQGWPTGQP